MSTNNTQQTPTTTTTGAPAGSTHVEDAAAMIQEFQAMSQRISKFGFAEDANANRRLAAAASVPQAAIDKATALVQTKPLLAGTRLGPDDFRDRVSFVSAYGPLPDEAEAFADGLRHTLNEVKAELGDATLALYEVAKRQARRASGADLRPHVADLKRLLSTRFGRNRTKQQTAPQTPTPPSAPQSTSSSTPAISQPKVQSAASAAAATDPVVTSPATAVKSQ